MSARMSREEAEVLAQKYRHAILNQTNNHVDYYHAKIIDALCAPMDGEEVLRFSGECIKALSVAHRPGVQDGDYSLYAPGLKDGESYTVVVTRNAKPEPMTEEPKPTLADMEKLKVEYRPIDIFQEPKQKVTRDEAWRIVTEIIAGNAHSATECLMAAINGE